MTSPATRTDPALTRVKRKPRRTIAGVAERRNPLFVLLAIHEQLRLESQKYIASRAILERLNLRRPANTKDCKIPVDFMAVGDLSHAQHQVPRMDDFLLLSL